jgi:hypothetical protein
MILAWQKKHSGRPHEVLDTEDFGLDPVKRRQEPVNEDQERTKQGRNQVDQGGSGQDQLQERYAEVGGTAYIGRFIKP